MAPPANSGDLASAKKDKKSKSKEERKRKENKHERTASDEASLRDDAQDVKRKKLKHKDGQEGKEHGKKPKKERKAEAEAVEVKGGNEKMRRAMEDERFAAARTDPRFRPMRRKEAKVALDSTFSSMLTDRGSLRRLRQ